MAELTESDLELLIGMTASLEGYFRLDAGDPTARAYALKHLAARAADDLGGEQVAERVAAVGARLRAQLGARR